jgi:futalosine hydrolase
VPCFLIVAATQAEVKPLLNHFNITVQGAEGLFVSETGPENVSVLITGVGMVNTAWYLGKCSEKSFDLVLNIGICGAFHKEIKTGEIVNVVTDVICEMGAEDGEDFIPYKKLNLGGTNEYKNSSGITFHAIEQLRKAKGITVNKVHGNEEQIKKAMARFQPDVESMEGAAFLRGCASFDNYYQLRAVSNHVEKRDKSKWNMALAVNNVNEFVIQLITELQIKPTP